jgi:hypothetical protein
MQCPAGSGIDWFIFERIRIGAFVRRAERGGEVFAGAATGIDESSIEELLPGVAI